MKRFDMTNRKDRAPPDLPKTSQTTDSAFDLWLNRGLHRLYDDVAREPVPEDILKLLRDDKGDK